MFIDNEHANIVNIILKTKLLQDKFRKSHITFINVTKSAYTIKILSRFSYNDSVLKMNLINESHNV